MRTTITLDDDVAAMLDRLAQGPADEIQGTGKPGAKRRAQAFVRPEKKTAFLSHKTVNLGSCRAGHIDNVAEVLAVAEGELFK